MKNRAQLEDLMQSLYWNWEHGEIVEAVNKLMALQTEAIDQVVRAIEPVNPLATSPFTQGRNECVRIILTLQRDIQTTQPKSS